MRLPPKHPSDPQEAVPVPLPSTPEVADAYVISFPKCGRTWLLLLIARAISLGRDLPMEVFRDMRLAGFGQVDRMIPKIVFWHDDHPGWHTPSELSRDKKFYERSKVVFLARDLRDVTVSYYFQRTLRPNNPFNGNLNEFLTEERGSLLACIEFWNIWQAAQRVPASFLLTSYERLASDTQGELRRILRFLGIPSCCGDETLAMAADYANFGNMRTMELADAFRSEKLRPGNVQLAESFKTRRGIVGGFRDYLTQQQVDLIGRLIDDRLVPEWHPVAFAAG